MKKVLFGFTIGIIVTLSIVVGATILYNASDIEYTPNDTAWNVNSVSDAIDDLHNSITTRSLQKIYVSLNAVNDYEYTVTEEGTYLAVAFDCNGSGEVTTDGNIKFSELIKNPARKVDLKVIEAEIGTKIRVKVNGHNAQGHTANSLIYKVNNINITNVAVSELGSDSDAQLNYTAKDSKEKLLILSLSSGYEYSNSITYSNEYEGTFSHSAGIWLDYVILKKDESVNISSYGYNWGASASIILK